MKKVLVVNTAYKEPGGEDSNFKDEIKLLKKKYEVEHIEFDNKNKIDIYDLISFITKTNLKSNKILLQKLKLFEPDIVYVHNLWFKAGLGLLKILNENQVTTLIKIHNFRYYCASSYSFKKHLKNHDFCPACSLSSKKNLKFNKYFNDSILKSIFLISFTKKFLKILYKYKLKILTITNFHSEFLINKKIDKNKIFLYNNPISISGIQNEKYNPKSNFVVFAGRLTESKGVTKLLDSWIKLNNNSMSLKIVGTGNLEKELREKYKANNIEFCGFLDNNKTKNLIKSSRAVITTTLMYEGQPRLLCEASSFGVPSIFPKFGGMEDFFPKNYQLSFDQYDYSDLDIKLKILEDEKKLSKIGNENYIFIKNYLNEEKLLEKFESFI